MAGSVKCSFDLRSLTGSLKAKGNRVRGVVGKALRAGAKPVTQEVKSELQNLPPDKGWEHTGLTAKAIGIIRIRTKGDQGSIKIGARGGIKVTRDQKTGTRTIVSSRFRKLVTQGKQLLIFDPQKVLHFLELGTRAHEVGNRHHPGAKAFRSLQQGLARRQAEAQERMTEVLRGAITA